jgi:Tol biopolymer transport system component
MVIRTRALVRAPLLLLAAVVLLVGPAALRVGPADAAVPRTTLVSSSSAGVRGDSGSYSSDVDRNGTLVAFMSGSTNLDPLDPDGLSDVYVKNVATGALELVSVDLAGAAAGAASEPSISADGRYVAFSSSASDIVAGDTNDAVDVFVRDLVSRTTVLASRNNAGDQGDDASGSPSISGDGRYVAFVSIARNLPSAGAPHSVWRQDVYLRDLVAGTTVRVSVDATDPTDGGNGMSYHPDISEDGRFVAYGSASDNLLATPDTNATGDVFWWDRLGLTPTLRVSVAGWNTQGDADSNHPSISADGRYVAFHSLASNFGGTGGQVYVRDITLQSTQQVSRNGQGVLANGYSEFPTISADGRHVAFESRATNLVANDTNGRMDVFVRDRTAKTTVRVSLTETGAQANGSCYHPSVSADGSHVAYWSSATNLVGNDTNGVLHDVFISPTVLEAHPPSPTRTDHPVPGLPGDRLPGDRLSGDRLSGDRLSGDRLSGDRGGAR